MKLTGSGVTAEITFKIRCTECNHVSKRHFKSRQASKEQKVKLKVDCDECGIEYTIKITMPTEFQAT